VVRLSKASLGDQEKAAVIAVLSQGYLGMGADVKAFEEALQGYLQADHVMCVSTGTAALHLALLGAGIGPGDEVLVQSLTFVADFQAIRAAGAMPVACEILPETCTIDLDDAARRLTDRTKAVMPVHYASRPGDLDAIYAFARAHGLRVIEDASHAFGTVYKGRRIGSFGDMVCFSFDGIKNITAGEGGAVVTSDPRAADVVRDARLLGVVRDTEQRFKGQRSWEFDVVGPGYRYHMSNLCAAIGLAQLARLEGEFKPARQRRARRYQERLSALEGLALFPDDFDDVLPHIYPIRVLGARRDSVREHLLAHRIEVGIHYYPNHLLSYFGGRRGALPVTERVYQELLTLPLHVDLSTDEQDYVIEMLNVGLLA
jgi:dTDP-4-amino-4,6-dideoxygalactose transaminase